MSTGCNQCMLGWPLFLPLFPHALSSFPFSKVKQFHCDRLSKIKCKANNKDGRKTTPASVEAFTIVYWFLFANNKSAGLHIHPFLSFSALRVAGAGAHLNYLWVKGGYSLDKSRFYHRVDVEGQTSIHIHSYCILEIISSWQFASFAYHWTHRQPIHAQEQHVNTQKGPSGNQTLLLWGDNASYRTTTQLPKWYSYFHSFVSVIKTCQFIINYMGKKLTL